MSNKQALLDCTFGWGKTCRLYSDSIEIAGKSYHLDDLTSIRPTYRTLFGIPSARLELCFGPHRLTLRGIPDAETVRQIVAHLLPYAEQAHPAHVRTKKTRDLTRAQAKTWERTKELSILPDAQQAATALTPETDAATCRDQSLSQSEEDADIFDDFLDIAEQPSTHISANTPPAPVQPMPVEDTTQQATLPILLLTEKLDKRILTNQSPVSLPLVVEAPSVQPSQQANSVTTLQPLPRTKMRPLRIPRREPPLRSVQLVNALSAPEQMPSCAIDVTTHKSASEAKIPVTDSAPISTRKSSVLPVIHVPVRLQPGECAHYSIGAALCSDTLTSATYADQPPLDQGLLILTNRRVFYLGKRCQLILAYTHLWYVSRLQNAVALHIEGQFRRIIIEIEHPQEWASRIEQLAFIARRSPVRSMPSAPTFVLPGIRPASALPITIKRAALNLSGRYTDSSCLPVPDQHTVESIPQAYQSIIDTPTMVVGQSVQNIEEIATHEFAPLTDLDTIKIQTQTPDSYAEAEEVTHKITVHSTDAPHIEPTLLNTPSDSQPDLTEEATDKIEAIAKKT